MPNPDAAWSFIGGFGDLLAKAAQANMEYGQQASTSSNSHDDSDTACSQSLLARLKEVSNSHATPQQQAIKGA